MRETFTSRFGFVVAAIGSAVGLGNIWRFSYIAGENGGAVFLILYAIFVALIGFPLIVAELALGRRASSDAVTAFEKDGGRRPWRYFGWVCLFGACLVLSYYVVVAGWALKYLSGALTGELWREARGGYGAYFTRFIGNLGEPVAWQAAMLLMGMFVVAGGVRRGIERANRLIMPLLAGIVILLAGFSLALPGAEKGVRFLIQPDWSELERPGVYLAALGQAFFSIGVGLAVFITYGSYMRREDRVPGIALAVVFGDTLFALIAGLAIFPAVFAFGVDPASGPELAFITLPQVFLQMPMGTVLGPIFFFLLVAAALTSIVSLLEVPVAFAIQRLSMRRWTAITAAGSLIFLIGIPSALSFGVLKSVRIAELPVLDAIDHAVSNLVLPFGGLLIALFVGWKVKRQDMVQAANLRDGAVGSIWQWLLRIPVPIAIASIVVNASGLF